MILETTRLKIIPLTANEFRLYLLGIDKMEASLGLASSGEMLNEYMQEAMEFQYQKALNDTHYFLWLTSRQIILKSENRAIGSLCFKNSPAESSYVEVGYGIDEAYQNKGYMTEALYSVCEWALNCTEIDAVTAETLKDNFASHKVLHKCGFRVYGETADYFCWKLKK